MTFHAPRRPCVASSAGRHRGFTLVELLVVIAIIGVLVGLLLPAVQAARESGRRAACVSKIKQLGLGMLSYEAAKKRLPNNYGKESAATPGLPAPEIDQTSRGRSWITLILPYIEQATLYDRIRLDQPIEDPVNVLAFSQAIAGLGCPSDSNNPGTMANRENIGAVGTNTTGAWGTTNYKAVAGANWEFGTYRNDFPGGRWANDKNGFDNGNGIICRNKLNDPGNLTKVTQITDGMSKTFAIGEAIPEWCSHTTWFHCNHSTATCGIPLNNGVGSINLPSRASDWENNYSFFSRHPGGAAFTMCDGATVFVTSSIDLQVYRRLATIDTGEPAALP